ncbi:MurR/RpiR family transcriptional regulator (plasmid) [Skermanella mucosa]|uniref:MurR/RpiR family transcriptional regulator n=1 Tax=Skermanella mucosa TaxID=1789672 RepID=UPI001E61159D|nr:MurR/RpiR family transcriptional regulator [Skermanella mucosa]UEM24497.1 MurR/RpiR family transcriptional regulator [Skermanella mucosa]
MESRSSLISLILDHRGAMSASHGRLADHILANPLQSATMGIEQLAGAAGVSVATVNRFVRALGLAGYAEFRARSVEAFQQTIGPIEKLRDQEGAPREPAAIFAAALRAAAANVEESERLLNGDACGRAADMILSAGTVVLVGAGIGAALADFTAEIMAPFCKGQLLLTGWGGPERMMRHAMRIGGGDVVIGLTVPRYSRSTIDLVRSLRGQGAGVIGLTDAPTSPIVPHCDVALFGSAQHPVLHASVTGIVAMAEGLAAVLTRRRQTVAEATELTERIYPYLVDDDAGPTEDFI